MLDFPPKHGKSDWLTVDATEIDRLRIRTCLFDTFLAGAVEMI